jgi:hypothetical protein
MRNTFGTRSGADFSMKGGSAMSSVSIDGTLFPDADPRSADWIKNVGLGGSPRNADLALIYRKAWGTLSRLCDQDARLSAPYFAWVHPDYESVGIKLVVVGRETNGWGHLEGDYSDFPDQAARSLMHEYRDFDLGAGYSGRATFWNPVRDLYGRLNGDAAPQSGFVALNASIMDQASCQPEASVRDALIGLRLLPNQIAALEPDVVVFYTGPTYEEWIDLSFPGVSRSGTALLARLTAPGLPEFTFRTYHPAYLSRRRALDDVHERVVETVRGGAEQ